jgi:hypothetical protein
MTNGNYEGAPPTFEIISEPADGDEQAALAAGLKEVEQAVAEYKARMAAELANIGDHDEEEYSSAGGLVVQFG